VSLAFNFQVQILPGSPSPSYAFESRRDQYYSSRILDQLVKQLPDDGFKILGISDIDMATPVLSFVFGEAQLNGPAAIISIKRLKQEFYQLIANQSILLGRAVKEAVHELGHTFGLLHCDDTQCVMHFSSTITGIDNKDLNFCPNCLVLLQRSLQ
jgi:archaemetzincin